MKNFIKKLVFASVMLVTVAVLTAFLFVLYFKSVEEDNYTKNSKVSFENSFTYFEANTNNAKALLDEYVFVSYPDVDDGQDDEQTNIEENGNEDNESGEEENNGTYSPFDISDLSSTGVSPHIDTVLSLDAGTRFVGMGYVSIPTGGAIADVIFCDNGRQLSLKIISNVYSGFGDEYIMFRGTTADSESYYFYGKRVNDSAAGYDFLLAVADMSSVAGFSGYSFSNFAVINKHGVVVDSLREDTDFASVLPGEIEGSFMTLGSTEYLVFSKSSDDCFQDYYLVGVIDKATIDSHITGMAVRVYIFIAITCLAGLGIFALFLYLTMKDTDQIGTAEYCIKVDIEGEILGVDKAFKQKHKKLAGNIKDYVDDNISGDLVIVKAEKLDGEFAYYSCKKQIKKGSRKISFLASDITILYKDYMKIYLQHFTDDITQLPNIMQMEIDFVEMQEGRGKSDICIIVYELGIEKYSALYGYEFYRKVLKLLADRLSEVYSLTAKLYYLTADRIMVMANKNINETIAKIDSVTEYVGSAVRIDDLIISAVVKAGFLVCGMNDESISFSQIISRAEVAVSYARNSTKKSNYGYVDSVMRSKQALSNEDVREIIDSGEISINYQPQYSFSKKKIVGFETLTRLSGKYAYISPGAFIENLEQSGSMVTFGDFIIEKAMQFASSLEDKNIKISINVSPVQLLGDKFVDRFIASINTHGLEPSQIGIEITETYEISSMERAKTMLKELQKQGIHISIDDYGEKYSSLRYIKHLPINAIKIDKSFVDGVESDNYSKTIVESIVGMARKLGLYTVVEGVETLGQVNALKALGADIIQGYIIGMALTEDVAKEYILAKKNLFEGEGSKK